MSEKTTSDSSEPTAAREGKNGNTINDVDAMSEGWGQSSELLPESIRPLVASVVKSNLDCVYTRKNYPQNQKEADINTALEAKQKALSKLEEETKSFIEKLAGK